MQARDQHKRLQQARRAAGYATASAAAEALGAKATTYLAHENGEKGLSRAGERYARFFRVSLEWLLTGKGEMRPRRGSAVIPVAGLVGAGAAIEPIEALTRDEIPDHVEWPDAETLGALIVHGDSQLPRYRAGEVILYDTRPRMPRELLNEMAIVQCEDGRRLVKRIRKNAIPGRYNLESLNADLEEDVPLLAAYEIIGALTRR